MSTQSLAFFVTVITLYTVSAELVCDAPNQMHSNVTPMCPRTCKKEPLCLGLINKESCQCAVGYVRLSNTNTTCVKEAECPDSKVDQPLLCKGENEQLYQYTPVCPETCDTLNKMRCLAIIDKPSCQCTNNTVRDTNTNKCVAREECPTVKSYNELAPIVCEAPNERFSEWISACPLKCPLHGQKPSPMTCQAIVYQPSCVCTNGTIRDTVNNRCVRPEECPPVSAFYVQ